MINKYFPTVSIADIKEIIEAINVSKDYVIQIDDEDISSTLLDTDNAVLIEGRSSGEGKVEKALAEIESQARSLIAENLYSAKRILIYIESDPKDDIRIDEMNALNDFISRFNSNIDVIWGVSRRTLDGNDSIAVKLLASGVE